MEIARRRCGCERGCLRALKTLYEEGAVEIGHGRRVWPGRRLPSSQLTEGLRIAGAMAAAMRYRIPMQMLGLDARKSPQDRPVGWGMWEMWDAGRRAGGMCFDVLEVGGEATKQRTCLDSPR